MLYSTLVIVKIVCLEGMENANPYMVRILVKGFAREREVAWFIMILDSEKPESIYIVTKNVVYFLIYNCVSGYGGRLKKCLPERFLIKCCYKYVHLKG
jgi:hypothetical protein